MKTTLLLLKYKFEYVRFDKLTYKLLSLPAEEQDRDLLNEYIAIKDTYAEAIAQLEEQRRTQHVGLRRAVAYAALILAVVLAGTGVAEAAGFHIWREVVSFGSRLIVINGTDDAKDPGEVDYVLTDSDESAVTTAYRSVTEANEAIGMTTGLYDDILDGYKVSEAKVTQVGEIYQLDAVYVKANKYFAVRVTVIENTGEYMTGISFDKDKYTEREIAGITCSIHRADGMTSCVFFTGEGTGCLYTVRTNSDDAELETLVGRIAFIMEGGGAS